MTTLAELRNGRDVVYEAKMVHPIPDAKVIDREAFIVERCAGKVVLDIGASGELHKGIIDVAKYTYGIDRPTADRPANYFSAGDAGIAWMHYIGGRSHEFGIDLDRSDMIMPTELGIDLIICGEVVEHLSNPGWLLHRLSETYPEVPVIISVPNAFCELQKPYLAAGKECVNSDHVAWYSPQTLKTLLNRHGYAISEFYWYRGRPKVSEGMVVVAEQSHG